MFLFRYVRPVLYSSAANPGKEDRGATYLKFGMQSMPFGSSLLNTKQLNAALNCSPHGPCAMPPKQGHSQLISPVASLKAPSCEASSSVASRSWVVDGMGFGLAVSGVWEGGWVSLVGGFEVGVAFWEVWEAASSGVGGGGVRFLMARDSRVWRVGSSVGDWGRGMETVE